LTFYFCQTKVNVPHPINTTSHHGRTGAASLSSIAYTLASARRQDYIVPGSNETRCNVFVSDFVSRYFKGSSPNEFSGTANSIFDKLDASGNWLGYPVEQPSLQLAQQAANNGTLTLIGFKDETDEGHLAIVVPSKRRNGTMGHSGKWGMRVPFIAQAGTSIFDYKEMSWGFAADKRDRMKVFIYNGTTR